MGIVSEYKLKDQCFACIRTAVGVSNYKEIAYGPESHRRFEMIYVEKGEVGFNIEDEHYMVEAGDIIFVMPNEIHSIIEKGDTAYERTLIYFDFELLRQMFSVADIELENAFYDLSRVNRVIPEKLVKKYGLKELITETKEVDKSERNSELRFMSKIFDLIVTLSDTANDSEGGAKPISKEPLIKSIIEYIDAHITEQIKLDDIASELYISKSTLCHKFANHMSISVNRYIALKKVQFAAELIRNGKSATEAAIMAGYDQYTTFYHNYKQIMGRSPSDDMKSRRGN